MCFRWKVRQSKISRQSGLKLHHKHSVWKNNDQTKNLYLVNGNNNNLTNLRFIWCQAGISDRYHLSALFGSLRGPGCYFLYLFALYLNTYIYKRINWEIPAIIHKNMESLWNMPGVNIKKKSKKQRYCLFKGG